MENRIYLGPYIKCKPKVTKSYKVYLQKSCGNKNCKEFNKPLREKRKDEHIFCFICGSKILEKESSYERDSKIDLHQIFGDNFIYRFEEFNIQFLIPNEQSSHFIDLNEVVFRNLLNYNINNDIKIFENEYNYIIASLEENCDEFEICWGLLNI